MSCNMNDMKQSKTVANKTGSLSPTFCYFEIKKNILQKIQVLHKEEDTHCTVERLFKGE